MKERCAHLSKTLIGVAASLVLALVLVGCSAPSQNAESQDPSRVYQDQVNAIASELSLHLKSFDEAVATGNIYTMRSEADDAFKSIDKLSSITAPDNYSEVQQDYVNGCNDLKGALSSYLDIYSAMQNATDEHPFDYAAYEGQLKTIQDQYNAGIEALQAGDQKASSS